MIHQSLVSKWCEVNEKNLIAPKKQQHQKLHKSCYNEKQNCYSKSDAWCMETFLKSP